MAFDKSNEEWDGEHLATLNNFSNRCIFVHGQLIAQKNTAINMGLWQVGLTEVIEH